MKNEKQPQKGFFGFLREAFGKTGGCCCGPGETCGGPGKAPAKEPNEEIRKTQSATPPEPK